VRRGLGESGTSATWLEFGRTSDDLVGGRFCRGDSDLEMAEVRGFSLDRGRKRDRAVKVKVWRIYPKSLCG